MKISIIVPVYNCAKYLRECINSCLAEKDVYNIEVLLVDDGSTDESGNICDEYAYRYPQVMVIHTENKGVSCARNTGIEKSTGEWIMFVDADDILDSNTLGILDKQADFQQYDVTRFGAYRFEKVGSRILYSNGIYSDNIESQRNLILRRDTLTVVWAGIYSRNLFIDNSIRFSSGIRAGEDWIVLFKLFCHANTFYYMDKRLYGYRVNPEGVMMKKINFVRPDVLIAYNIILDYAKVHEVLLKEESLRIAKSDLRRGYKRRAVYSNSRKYYIDVCNVLQRYVPQSTWNDICYCKKPKHIIVFFAYAVLSPCYRFFDKVLSIRSKH